MKKRLILILNGKGGVGKSFFAVHFVQYLKDHQIAHAAFDSDDENSTLKRFHSEVGFINPNNPVEIDRMVEALKDKDVVVVDCRAASTRIFLKYFEDTDLATILESLGAGLTIASPVNHELDSIHQIQRLVGGIAGQSGLPGHTQRSPRRRLRPVRQIQNPSEAVERTWRKRNTCHPNVQMASRGFAAEQGHSHYGSELQDFTIIDRQRLVNVATPVLRAN
jgi:hypothetical protein